MTAIVASSSAPSDQSPRRPSDLDVIRQQLFALRAQLMASLEHIDGILGHVMLIAPDVPQDPTALSQATTKLRNAQGGVQRGPVETFGGEEQGSSPLPLVAQE